MTFNMSAYIASSQPSAVVISQNADVSLQLFYDELSPHGTWISYQNYGYVWMPNAGSDFQPYATSGQWVFTDMGWTWYSSYSWGWAPFHYGRWFYDNYYGWMWLPDTEWGPAWVTWRSGGDYYGWAPMEPGISVSIAFGGTYQAPNNHWIFVRNQDIDRQNVRSFSINQTNNTTIINNTTVIQNTRMDRQRNVIYITGPDRDDVQTKRRKPVNQIVIQENTRPGQNVNNREMKIYRPRVQPEQGDNRRSAPIKVEKIDNVRPVTERYNTKPQHNKKQAPSPDLNQRNNQNQNKERPKTPPRQKEPPKNKKRGNN